LHIAIDGPRNLLYIGDVNNNRVRRVNLATGIITNYAGQGISGFGVSGDGGPATAAKLAFPDGVAADGAGLLSIADVYNGRIRRVDPVSGIITTVAGTGSIFGSCPGFSGDGGPATSACIGGIADVAADHAGNIFILDTGDFGTRRVRRVDAATGVITTVAGGGATIPGSGPATSMNLDGHEGIGVDAAGTTLYIAGGHHSPENPNDYSGRV
jgi:hypothetical protein